jgi:hypothetical protein
VEAYRSALRSLLNPDLPNHEWSYPPSILLLGVPLSWFPIFPAYLLFICVTLLALHVVLKPFQFPFIAHLAILLGPPGMISITFGQNGNLTGALMIGALAFSQRRPWLAGMMAGLLTIKPQLGILLPIAYLAAGNWKAIFSAILTAVLMALATGFFFGFHVWLGFLTATAPLMSGIMNAPFPQDYQVNSVTFFITARYLGFDVPMAHLFQAFFTLAAMLLTFMIWRPPGRLDIFSRSLLTTLLVIMATPYGYSYDMVPYSVAVAWWFMRNPAPNRLFFAALWLFPAFAHIPGFFGIGLSIMVPAIFIIWVLREERILFGAKPWIAAG